MMTPRLETFKEYTVFPHISCMLIKLKYFMTLSNAAYFVILKECSSNLSRDLQHESVHRMLTVLLLSGTKQIQHTHTKKETNTKRQIQKDKSKKTILKRQIQKDKSKKTNLRRQIQKDKSKKKIQKDKSKKTNPKRQIQN